MVPRALRDLEAKWYDRTSGGFRYLRALDQTELHLVANPGFARAGTSKHRDFSNHLRRNRQPGAGQEYGLLWGGSTNPREDTDASLEHAEELCQQFIERKISGVFFAPAELQSGQEEANLGLPNLFGRRAFRSC